MDYTITIHGPQGEVVLTARLDSRSRQIEAQVQGEHLRPLLIITSVLSGHVAGMLTVNESPARLPATSTPPASQMGIVHRPGTGVGASSSSGGPAA